MGEIIERAPPTGRELTAALRRMLRAKIPDLDRVLADLGQIAAAERRAAGGSFTFREHVRGLLLAQLSNQRPWLPIARMLPEIEKALLGFDPAALERAEPAELVARLRTLRAGNRAITAQMRDLAVNIGTLRRIERDRRSIDAFVTSASPEEVAQRIADPRSPCKLSQVGFALAMEYLRNVGVSTAKPDTHVLRILGPERLGYFEAGTSLDDVVRIIERLALDAGISTTELDNLVWLFGARGYGAICKAEPECEVCELAPRCRHSVGGGAAAWALTRALAPAADAATVDLPRAWPHQLRVLDAERNARRSSRPWSDLDWSGKFELGCVSRPSKEAEFRDNRSGSISP